MWRAWQLSSGLIFLIAPIIKFVMPWLTVLLTHLLVQWTSLDGISTTDGESMSLHIFSDIFSDWLQHEFISLTSVCVRSFVFRGTVNAGLAYELLSKGCEKAGGATEPPEGQELSYFANGGKHQKNLGCTSHEHCEQNNPCLGEFVCTAGACVQVPGTAPVCDDGKKVSNLLSTLSSLWLWVLLWRLARVLLLSVRLTHAMDRGRWQISVFTLRNPVKTATSATGLWPAMKQRVLALKKSLRLTVMTRTHVPLVSVIPAKMFL